MSFTPESEFSIGRSLVGLNRPSYFIADIAANHDGDLERAKHLVQLCAECGVDAAKFQNFKAETIVSDFGFKALGGQQSHQAEWGKSVFEVYRDASIPDHWTSVLKETCDQAGIDYLTAPYDLSVIDEIDPYVCAWKVGSGDITWLENIEALSSRNKPVLLSTGASDMTDVVRAVDAVLEKTPRLVLMQCNTNYTASVENFHHIALNVLKAYAERWPTAVLGLSDHTPGYATVLGSVAFGARVIEKHFTDDSTREGPDHAFSMTPESWQEMVDRTRELEAALGTSEKRVMGNEEETVVLQRRALRATRDLAAGELIAADDLIPLRPCPLDAAAPYQKHQLIGKRLKGAIAEGDCVRLGDVE